MRDLEKAIEILTNGGTISIPTETVYGLAGRIDSPEAINNIFALKKRPFFDPLIVHVASIEQAKDFTLNWNKTSEILAAKFWPGSLTLILPKHSKVNSMITSGLDTVGVRVPKHPLTLELIKKLNAPIAAPSANFFKKTSPTKASHVENSFPDLFVLNGGECSVGIESTIVHATETQVFILRPGMISKSDIEEVLLEHQINLPVVIKESEIASGHLKHHYMPELPLIVQYGDNLDLSHLPKELLLKPTIFEVQDDPIVVARELYQKLRDFDSNASSIIFKLNSDVLDQESWQGIINRLNKAASYTLSK